MADHHEPALYWLGQNNCAHKLHRKPFFFSKINPVWTPSSSVYWGKINKKTNKQWTKGANSAAEREGRISHNATAHAVISARLLSIFFHGRVKQEAWKSGRGLGRTRGGWIWSLRCRCKAWVVETDGNRNKTQKGGLWCTWTHYKKDAWQQLLLFYDS